MITLIQARYTGFYLPCLCSTQITHICDYRKIPELFPSSPAFSPLMIPESANSLIGRALAYFWMIVKDFVALPSSSSGTKNQSHLTTRRSGLAALCLLFNYLRRAVVDAFGPSPNSWLSSRKRTPPDISARPTQPANTSPP